MLFILLQFWKEATRTVLADSCGNTRDVAIGDVDGDGHIDLLFVGYNISNRLYLQSNLGMFGGLSVDPNAGTEALNFYTGTVNNSPTVKVVDIDDDGNPDIVVGNHYDFDKVYLGNSDGTFQSAINITDDEDNSRDIVVILP